MMRVRQGKESGDTLNGPTQAIHDIEYTAQLTQQHLLVDVYGEILHGG